MSASPPQEERWGWVGQAWAEYREKETTGIRSMITSGHEAVQRVQTGLEEVSATVDRVTSTAEAHMIMSLDKFWANARKATFDYPLAVVGASTGLFGAALGAANGSMLGRAPKRCAAIGLLVGATLRGPILEKHGSQMAAASGWLSMIFRCVHEVPCPHG